MGWSQSQQIINQQENRSNNKQEDGFDRTTETDKSLPKFLGQSEEEQKASRVLATAASIGREDSRGNESQKTVQRGQLLLTIETEAKKEGIWIEKPAELVIKKIGEGQENIVLLSKDKINVVKFNLLKDLNSVDDIPKVIDKINSHNEFAANVPYFIIGFTKDKNGNVGLLMQQP